MEYIYLNNENIIKEDVTRLYNDINFIINKKNSLFMIDNNQKSSIHTDDLLEFIPEVDLIVLDENNPLPKLNLNEMVNSDTIISKIFKNDIIYIEDKNKEQIILLTKEYMYLIEGSGITTEVSVTRLD